VADLVFNVPPQIEAKKQAGEGLRTIFGGEEQTDEEKKISAALEKVAAEHGTESITAIAIACEFTRKPSVLTRR
jgi:predicted oxidoreductase